MKIDEEFKKLHDFHGKTNCKLSPIDKRDHIAEFTKEENQPELEKVYIGFTPDKIKDQGNVGSCVAHGTSSVFEHLNELHNGQYQEFSTGFIYGNKDDHTEGGMDLRSALKFINNTGDCLETDFPYNLEITDIFAKIDEVGNDKLTALANQHKELIGYAQVSTPYDIKSAIKKYGAVVIVIPWYDENYLDFETINNNGVEDYTATLVQGVTLKGYHCVYLTGWNDNDSYFNLVNSWNKSWGWNGQCRLPYSYPIEEAWIMEGYVLEPHNNPVPSPIPVPEPVIHKKSDNEFIQTLWKIINVIINWFFKK